MVVEVDRAVADLAGRQDGVVTRRQLLELHLSEDDVRSWRRSGRLYGVHRGVHHLGHAALGDRARLRAALLAVGDRAVLSHRTAAALWELLRWAGPPQLTTTARTGRA